MDELLKEKNIIVTGARRGIGRSVVEVLARNGANVWACARKKDDIFEEEMSGLAEKYRKNIWPVYFDTTCEAEIKTAVAAIRKQKKSIDALVNVAGVVDESTSFAMTSMEKMRQVFDVNFWGVTLLTQYISRIMVRQNYGSIINISSIAGIDGEPAQYEYASSKAAVIGAVKQLSRELGKNNIRVNAIAPGIINTQMGAQIEDGLKDYILSKVIMKRTGEPEEIANVVAFLASDLSSYMTGQVIRVDGGM